MARTATLPPVALLAAPLAVAMALAAAAPAHAASPTGGTPAPVAPAAAVQPRLIAGAGGTQAPLAQGTGGTEYGVVQAAPHNSSSTGPPRARTARHPAHPSRRRSHAHRTAPKPRPPAPKPAPAPPVEQTPGVPTPAQTVAEGAVFPVGGPHSFGGPESRFGAPRAGHTHQGQDILAAEGLPDVAPLAGTIITTGYQAGGAGWYVAEHTAGAFDFFFAHCQARSVQVLTGQVVAAGTVLCKLGATGDATGPHLHFEMWVGGWRVPGGYPIDPLPYLEAWEAG